MRQESFWPVAFGRAKGRIVIALGSGCYLGETILIYGAKAKF